MEYSSGAYSLYQNKKPNLLYPVFIFWGIVIISLLGFLWYDAVQFDTRNRYFLLPYCILTGVAIVVPNLYLYHKGQFHIFNPLVYAAWSYFFPAFFIGGLVLSAGLHEPFYLTFVQDEGTDLPLTLIYVILGYLGLSLGYLMPFGKKIGTKIGDYLPKWDWKPEQVTIPALFLLGVGFINTGLAFVYGILGFQRAEEAGIYDGLLYLTTLWGIEASFILWLIMFRAKQLNVNHFLIAGILILFSISKSAFQGNRGSLIFFCIMIVCAFVFSGKTIYLRHKIFGGVLLVIALLVGMIYGSTFRSIKQNDAVVSIDYYAESVFNTFGQVSEQDLTATIGTGLGALSERIESVSPLAVVVSNYEILRPYEESYGLDNNIWKDSVTFFIPRIIWNDKPVASESHKYGDLYFNYGENSFVVTPMGDLLRNFGPVGVPLGMIILGFLLRIIYASLIENRDFSIWRITLFYMLLIHLSYEGFYGSIVPFLVKVGFISVVGFICINFVVKNRKSGKTLLQT